MGASQSFLSSREYGYDYVVAVTQDSINATALAFLRTKQPVVNVCYIYDDNGDPEQIDYEAFKKKANGADPFSVPESGPSRDTALKNLDDAGFMFGFRAAMGLPEGFDASKLPDIVTLAAPGVDTEHVIYRLLCKNFLLVELIQIPHKKPIFKTFAQPKGPGGKPWIFTFKVRIIKETVKDNKAFINAPAFGNLPAAIQTQLKNNPEDFTIQHLLFDFNNAGRESEPTIDGPTGHALEALSADFGKTYFNEMKKAGSQILAVTPASGGSFPNLQTEFSVNPSSTDPKLATLNYLCATDHQLPPAKPFAWNWVEPSEADSFDGVCVINRNLLAHYLKSQLDGYVNSNCLLPYGENVISQGLEEWAGFLVKDRTTFDSWDQLNKGRLKKQTFTPSAPTEGPILLQWQFSATGQDGAGWHDALGQIKVDTSFDMKVTCAGKTITIEQHTFLHYYLYLESLHEDTNLVDIKITDTFTLAAAGDRLTATSSSNKVDNSQEPQYWKSAKQVQGQMNAIKANVMNIIASRFSNIQVPLLNGIIFPGGKGFLFKDVVFSDHQDLVAHITYADPS